MAAAALLLASSCANDADDPATTTAADGGSLTGGMQTTGTTGTSTGDVGQPMGEPCQADDECMEALFCDMHGGDAGVCDGPHDHEPDCKADPAACGLGSSGTTTGTDSGTGTGSTGTGSTGTGSTGTGSTGTGSAG